MNDALGVRGLECVGNLHPQVEKLVRPAAVAGDEVLEGQPSISSIARKGWPSTSSISWIVQM